jgi:hypothetical protein
MRGSMSAHALSAFLGFSAIMNPIADASFFLGLTAYDSPVHVPCPCWSAGGRAAGALRSAPADRPCDVGVGFALFAVTARREPDRVKPIRCG